MNQPLNLISHFSGCVETARPAQRLLNCERCGRAAELYRYRIMKLKKYVITLSFLIANLLHASPEWDDGYRAYRDKDWKEAIELFEKIDPDDRKYATAMRYIGYNIYGREFGEWDKAIEYCIKAYRADPDDKKVLEDLGRACMKRKEELER